MSTIKTTNLQHPSAASPNLTLAADGSVSGGAGLGGLVHIATESFSGVSSVSLDNVFTSTYDNYRIVINQTCSGSVYLRLRLRSGGSDNTASSYTYQQFGANGTSYNFSRNTGVNATAYGYQDSGDGGAVIEMLSPNLAKETSLLSLFLSTYADAYNIQFVANHSSTNAFDGFTIYPDSGTTTGTLRVYGYANS